MTAKILPAFLISLAELARIMQDLVGKILTPEPIGTDWIGLKMPIKKAAKMTTFFNRGAWLVTLPGRLIIIFSPM